MRAVANDVVFDFALVVRPLYQHLFAGHFALSQKIIVRFEGGRALVRGNKQWLDLGVLSVQEKLLESNGPKPASVLAGRFWRSSSQTSSAGNGFNQTKEEFLAKFTA
jgi:hypothetical protein